VVNNLRGPETCVACGTFRGFVRVWIYLRRTGPQLSDMHHRHAFGFVGPSLWFPLFPNNDDESLFQKQAQAITRTFSARNLSGSPY
jgi:hypothetical protein